VLNLCVTFSVTGALDAAGQTSKQRAPMGMNAPFAPQNALLALNVAHWLTGVLP